MTTVRIYAVCLTIIVSMLVFHIVKNEKNTKVLPEEKYWEFTDDKDVKTEEIVTEIKKYCDVYFSDSFF